MVAIQEKAEELSTNANERIASAIKDIGDTRETYIEFMKLKGPVGYWTEKAARHKRNSIIATVVGLTYAAAILIYLSVDGYDRITQSVERAITLTKQWQVAYVEIAISLVFATILFWIGRLISRVYVSEQHLTIDAEERATMVMTYLALSNEKVVSEAERAIVLAALFRPSADGLVRDDGAPDLSLAGMLSRIVTPAPK